MSTVRILSIDSGGIRGLIPGVFLAELERLCQAPISTLFHMIAGTSTGGMLGMGLAKPERHTAQQMVDFYLKYGPEIFQHSLSRKALTLGGYWSEHYNVVPLEKALDVCFGDSWLSDCALDCLVTAYNIEERKTHQFLTWKARGEGLKSQQVAGDFDYRIREVTRATTAAPSYFSPALIYNRSGHTRAFIDGAVFASSPAQLALLAAKKLYPNARRFLIVSVGTGTTKRPIPYERAKKFGMLDWVRPVLDIQGDALEEGVDFALKRQLRREDYFRFQTHLDKFPDRSDGPSDNLDDASEENIERLQRRALEMIDSEREMLHRLVRRLTRNEKTDVETLK